VRRALLVAGLSLAALPAAPALADTTIGSTNATGTGCGQPGQQFALLYADTNYTVPTSGTITGFSFQSSTLNIPPITSSAQQLDFLVLRGGGGRQTGYYSVVGTTGLETLSGTGTDTFNLTGPAQIAVQAGDILGYWAPFGQTLANCEWTNTVSPGGAILPPPIHRWIDLTPPVVDLQDSFDVSMSDGSPFADTQDLNESANFVASPPALSITNTAPTSVVSGKPLAYTIVVSNTGGTPATGVQVSDQLPAGVRFVSTTSTQGTCTPPPKKSRTVTCTNVGTLAAAGSSGSSATITITVTPTTVGMLSDTATVMATNASSATSAPAQTTVTRKK
jgi:uncharacterized repeat protein (TIGR01451 family)